MRPAALVARGSRAAAMLSGAALLAAVAPGPGGQWLAELEEYPGLSLTAEAVVAGLLPAITQGWPWPDALRHAVALGASSDPLGEVDLDAYDLLSSEVVLAPAGGSSPADRPQPARPPDRPHPAGRRPPAPAGRLPRAPGPPAGHRAARRAGRAPGQPGQPGQHGDQQRDHGEPGPRAAECAVASKDPRKTR